VGGFARERCQKNVISLSFLRYAGWEPDIVMDQLRFKMPPSGILSVTGYLATTVGGSESHSIRIILRPHMKTPEYHVIWLPFRSRSHREKLVWAALAF
jgi:hypothetical protein